MKKLLAALLLLAALPLVWFGVVQDRVGNIAVGVRVQLVYQSRRVETILAWPFVSAGEQLGNLRNVGAELRELGEPTPVVLVVGPRHRTGTEREDRQQEEVRRHVVERLGDTSQADGWLDLSVEERWLRYSAPEMEAVRAATRGMWGFFGLIFVGLLATRVIKPLAKCVFFPVMLLYSIRKIRPSDAHGTAKWASDHTLRQLSPRRGEASLVIGTVGKYRKRLVSLPEWRHYEHVYLVAPPGAGKTSGVIIPNLLTEPGTRSLVITDPKRELLAKTWQKIAKTYGRENVWVLDFQDPLISRGFNPLAYVSDATSATLFADTWVQNTGVSSKDPFWGNVNRQIIAAVALHLVKTQSDPPLVALADMLASLPPKEIKRRLLESPAVEARRIASSQLEAIESNEKLLGSVFTEIAGRFECLLDPSIRAVTSRNEVEMALMARNPIVLYLPLHLEQKEYLKPLIACFFMNFYRTLSQVAMRLPSNRLPTKVMCYMDEFGVMGRIPRFEDEIARVRGFGIGCLMVVQSKSQLEAQYGGDAAKVILQSANTKLCMSRITGDDARMFADLAGTTTVITTSQTGSRPTLVPWQTSGSRGRSEAQRALITPDELRTMGEDVFAVMGDDYAFRARQRRYHEDPALRRLVPDIDEMDVFGLIARPQPLEDPGLGAPIPRHETVPMTAQELGPAPSINSSRSQSRTRSPEWERRMVEAEISADGVIGPRPTARIYGTSPLGTGETRVLELWAAGQTDAQISSHLCVSESWVAEAICSLLSKLRAATRDEALERARRHGLLASGAAGQHSSLDSSHPTVLRTPDTDAHRKDVSRVLSRGQPDEVATLTDKHLGVLRLMATGASNSRIAAELGLKPQSVKNYVTQIYARLGVRTRGEQGRRDAVAAVRSLGLLLEEGSQGRSRDN